eukprot:gene9226-8303_t
MATTAATEGSASRANPDAMPPYSIKSARTMRVILVAALAASVSAMAGRPPPTPPNLNYTCAPGQPE